MERIKLVTRKEPVVHGDLGVNEQYESYIYNKSQWRKFVNQPERLTNVYNILKFIEDSESWVTPHDIPFTDPITARKVLEHLHDEKRICKGPNDTYGNYIIYFKWRKKNDRKNNN